MYKKIKTIKKISIHVRILKYKKISFKKNYDIFKICKSYELVMCNRLSYDIYLIRWTFGISNFIKIENPVLTLK